MIKFIKDTDLFNDIKQYDIILIGTSTKCTKGNGFQYKIARNYRYPYDALEKFNYTCRDKMGKCVVVDKKDDMPMFIYCFITHGRYRPDLQPDALDYDGLKSCLELIASNFPNSKIASTIMGESIFEGGGNKERILSIFNEICKDLDLTLYDYCQIDFKLEDDSIYDEIVRKYKNKELTRVEYLEQLKIYEWHRKLGIFDEPPKDMSYPKSLKLLRNKEALARFLKEREENKN